MSKDKEGFKNGIYKDAGNGGAQVSCLDERANLLRAVSKSLLRFGVKRDLRERIIADLCNDFSLVLSAHGFDHFMEY